MKCDCGGRTRVLDSRGDYRRRECLTCGVRFSTAETVVGRQGVHMQAEPVAEKKRPRKRRVVGTMPLNTREQATKNASARRRLEEMRDNMGDGLNDL